MVVVTTGKEALPAISLQWDVYGIGGRSHDNALIKIFPVSTDHLVIFLVPEGVMNCWACPSAGVCMLIGVTMDFVTEPRLNTTRPGLPDASL